MFNRLLFNFKHQSYATLRSWTYQCESILAQRSRRFQQLFTFYHRVYGLNGLQQILRSYQKQLQPPLKGLVMSAVCLSGISMNNKQFDWTQERLSLANFDVCHRDIEFIETLPRNKLCDKCKAQHMKYCYCLLGNKKCRSSRSSTESIKNCRKKPLPFFSDGVQMIEMAEENPWEPYLSKDEFSIWKREEATGMYSYKVYARFDDICAEDLLHVQTDVNYRRQWDETAAELHLIEKDPKLGTNSHLIYWEMQWPKLFANRDYVYCRRFVQDEQRKVIMICSRGTKHPKYPVFPDKVRVNNYWSLMVIKPYRSFQEPGVHYILTYYDDPGLPIPQAIKTWVTQKQMPEFLHKMYMATKKYSCRGAIEMKQIHNLKELEINDNEYTANEARHNLFSRIWRQRNASK